MTSLNNTNIRVSRPHLTEILSGSLNRTAPPGRATNESGSKSTGSITLAMHQSQYLPWAPYFKKMMQTDVFVIMDNVQFQKNGLQNRNKIAGKSGPQWITVPVKSGLRATIADKIIADQSWRKKHLKSIQACYGRAPNFDKYFAEIKRIIDQEYTHLHQVNKNFIDYFREVLEIRNRLVTLSDLDIHSHKSNLILDTCRTLGATTYISGIGGTNYLDLEAFDNANIRVEFLESNPPNYSCRCSSDSGLSMLDYLMYEDVAVVRAYLTNQT